MDEDGGGLREARCLNDGRRAAAAIHTYLTEEVEPAA